MQSGAGFLVSRGIMRRAHLRKVRRAAQKISLAHTGFFSCAEKTAQIQGEAQATESALRVIFTSTVILRSVVPLYVPLTGGTSA